MQISTFVSILAALTLAKAATIHKPPSGFAEKNPHTAIKEDSFFVTFKGQPGTDAAKQDQDAFRAALTRLGIQATERRQFTEFINAVSIDVDKEAVSKIASIPNVKDVFPMLIHSPPRVFRKDVSNPALKFADGITGVKEVRDNIGFTGKGIKVGVIDTGIDYTHPALGGCYGKGCRVAYGYDFVGDAYTGANTPVPGGDPRDHCAGHGTHVSGIIGANSKNVTGVAPEVTLGAYRVFGCNGSTANDVIIAAMERAFKDGMDAINLSLGGGSAWPGYPDALVADKLADKGLLVVAAMGNDGDKGMWEASSPAIAAKGVAVASIDNTRYMAYGFSIDGSSGKSYDYANAQSGQPLGISAGQLVSAKGQTDDLACTALPANSLTGKIALVQRGTCTFVQKGVIAQAAGAIAVLVYNDVFGAITPAASDPTLKIPVAGITQESGQELVALLAKGAINITFTKDQQAYDNPTGGKVSDFSSWGPGPELEGKPDIAAPGGLIYSTYPVNMGAYATLSGTSMATPYITGSSALILQAKGKLSPTEVRDILKQNANPVTELTTGGINAVQRQGAGLVNVRNAVLGDTSVSPVALPLLSDDIKTGKVQHLKVKNTGDYPLHYEVTHRPALSVQSWDSKTGELLATPVFKAAPATVDISTKKFVLEPGHERSLVIFFHDPTSVPASERWLYSGYITIQPQLTYADMLNGNFKKQKPINVSYSGMSGSFKSASIFSSPDSGLPALFGGATGTPIAAAATAADNVFSLQNGDTPVAVTRLVLSCKHLVVSAIDANNKNVGVIDGGDNKLLGRNDDTQQNLSVQLPWDGKVSPSGSANSTVLVDAPNGVYHLHVQALRPFGKENVPSDWQTWDSPAFTIDRTKKPPTSGVSLDDKISKFLKSRIHSIGKNIEDADSMADSVLPRPFRVFPTKA